MLELTPILYPLHVLAAIVWVGGMFFAHMALRPSVLFLEPPRRLTLWAGVFPRFFLWVWISVATLLSTGTLLIAIHYGGMAAAPLHVHLMVGVGLLMSALFAYLYFVPYRRFRVAVDQGDWPTAAGHQARIRLIVATNLALGLANTTFGAAGRYWI